MNNDLAGRIMAHAFNDEMVKIAGAREVGRTLGFLGGSTAGALVGTGRRYGEALRLLKKPKSPRHATELLNTIATSGRKAGKRGEEIGSSLDKALARLRGARSF